jgi:hypothetical protein
MFHNNIGMRGEARFAKIGKDGVERFIFNTPSKNMILDVFINNAHAGILTVDTSLAANSTSGIGALCKIGTGSTEPVGSQTDLVSPVMSTSNYTVDQVLTGLVKNSAQGRYEMRRSIRCEFAPATQNLNISEVLIGTAATPTSALPVLSRMLVRNPQGEPTSSTLAIDEIFVVYYDFYMYIPISFSFNKTIKGVPTTFTVYYHKNNTTLNSLKMPFRASSVPRLEIDLQYYRPTKLTGEPAYPSNYTSSGFTLLTASHITSRTPDNTATGIKSKNRVSLTGIVGDIGALTLTTYQQINSTDAGYFLSIDPPINKLNTEVFDIEFITTLSRV